MEQLHLNRKEDPAENTHCAGDVAGNAYRSDGKDSGPAPGASVVGVKVLDENGSGRLSTIIKGISWCMDHKEEYNIRIISLSLSLGATVYESSRDDHWGYMEAQDAVDMAKSYPHYHSKQKMGI